MTTLRIRQLVIDELVAHAHAEAPNECCGLLLGTDDEINEVVRAHNALQSPTRFYLDPADHFEAIRRARRTNRLVRGSYHSHPKGPPHPSPTDAEQLNDPEMLVVIVSLALDPLGGPERTALRSVGGPERTALRSVGGPERTAPRSVSGPERAALRSWRGPFGAASIGVFRWTNGNFERIDFVPVP